MTFPFSNLPRQRLDSWSSSAAAEGAVARQRLLPPVVALALGLTAAGGLALSFPYGGLESRLAQEGDRGDPLHIEYLRVWLRARPQQPSLRLVLARLLMDAGDSASARTELQGLLDAPDRRLAARALLMALDIDLTLLARLPNNGEQDGLPNDAPRTALQAQINALLAAQRNVDWPEAIQLELAQRALRAGAGDLASHWFAQVLQSSMQLSADAWEQAALQVAGLGNSRLAAQLLIRAFKQASTVSDAQPMTQRQQEWRHLFNAALQQLAGAGAYDEALQLAEREIGPLAQDAETLEFLTRFALAANRPHVAQRWATQLLRLSLRLSATTEPYLDVRWTPVAFELNSPLPGQLAQATPVANNKAKDAEPPLPFNERVYTLSYEVFVANGNLHDALLLAQSAVKQAPQSIAWRKRLAQVADWSNDAPTALEQWHAIASATQDPMAWSEVRRRAPALFDWARWADALEHAATKGTLDISTQRDLLTAYENLGQPERAWQLIDRTLAQPATTNKQGIERRRQLLELATGLAERSGDDARRIALLRQIAREFGLTVPLALRLANAVYENGQLDEAQTTLATVRTQVRDDHPSYLAYWKATAAYARLAERQDLAIESLQRVIARGQGDDNDYLDLATLLADRQPRSAAELAEQAWGIGRKAFQARQALYLWSQVERGNNDLVRAFLQRLQKQASPQQWQQLERDADFRLQQATLYLYANDAVASVTEARAALQLRPQDTVARATLWWSLIASQQQAALKRELLQGDDDARNNHELVLPAVTGWLALQQPQPALRLLQTQAKRDPQVTLDPLWALTYADVLELAMRTDEALQWRYRAWQALRDRQVINALSKEQQAQGRIRLLSLATLFESGDLQRRRLNQWIQDNRQVGNEAAKIESEVLLSTLQAQGLSELVAALGSRLAKRNSREAVATPSINLANALALDERDQLARWVDRADSSSARQAVALPVQDHIEAARRVGGVAQAQSLAFEALDKSDADQAAHQRLSELTLPQATYVGASIERFSQQPLDETTFGVEGRLALTQRYTVSASARHTQRTADTGNGGLIKVPANDDWLALQATRLQDRGQISGRLHRRNGFSPQAVWGAALDWQVRLTPRLQLQTALGLREPAPLSSLLRVAGSRDHASVDAQLQLSQRDFAVLSLDSSRYQIQGGSRIGQGRLVRADWGHRWRIEEPSLSTRVFALSQSFSATPAVDAQRLPLLPAGQAASNASLLPRSTTQLGAQVSFGEGVRDQWRRAWRPFGSTTLLNDRISGGNYEWQLGAAGSVLGGDVLQLAIARGSSRGFNAVPWWQLQVQYRWLP